MMQYREPSNDQHRCDVCLKQAWGFSLMGLMPWEKQLKPHIQVCLDCTDMPPCGSKGIWQDGKLTCPHGYIFTKSADWIVLGKQAKLKWKIVGTTWKRTIKEWFGYELYMRVYHQ